MSHWRSLFPFFTQTSPTRAFLDSAASAQKPASVFAAMDQFASTKYANIHRGVHSLAEAATTGYEDARNTVAKFIGAKDPKSIIFTKGTTASVNMVALSLSRMLKRGDRIMATELEHHSNFLPWLRLASDLGTKLEVAPIQPSGDLDQQVLEEKLKSGIKLLAITHASNVMGTVTPLKEIIQMAHRYGALVLVDGAQGVPHRPVNVAELGADFYVFSGHKLYGPTGIGVLYISPDVIEKLPPAELGGGMVHRVSDTFEETTWAPAPYRFEAGTPPIIEAIGLKAAIDFVNEIGFKALLSHEEKLLARLIPGLKSIPDLIIYGNPQERVGVISFNIGEIHPHDIGTILDQYGVAVRVGHHCAQPLMKALGIQGCVRASLGLYNNEADIELLVEALKAAQQKMK